LVKSNLCLTKGRRSKSYTEFILKQNKFMKIYWFIPLIGLIWTRDLCDWKYKEWTLFRGLVSMFIMFENVFAIILLLIYFNILK